MALAGGIGDDLDMTQIKSGLSPSENRIAIQAALDAGGYISLPANTRIPLDRPPRDSDVRPASHALFATRPIIIDGPGSVLEVVPDGQMQPLGILRIGTDVTTYIGQVESISGKIVRVSFDPEIAMYEGATCGWLFSGNGGPWERIEVSSIAFPPTVSGKCVVTVASTPAHQYPFIKMAPSALPVRGYRVSGNSWYIDVGPIPSGIAPVAGQRLWLHHGIAFHNELLSEFVEVVETGTDSIRIAFPPLYPIDAKTCVLSLVPATDSVVLRGLKFGNSMGPTGTPSGGNAAMTSKFVAGLTIIGCEDLPSSRIGFQTVNTQMVSVDGCWFWNGFDMNTTLQMRMVDCLSGLVTLEEKCASSVFKNISTLPDQTGTKGSQVIYTDPTIVGCSFDLNLMGPVSVIQLRGNQATVVARSYYRGGTLIKVDQGVGNKITVVAG